MTPRTGSDGSLRPMALDASVVVATHSRAARLSRLLDALALQEGVGRFEVIVVDDASTDDTQAVLAGRAPDLPFPLVVLRQDVNAGPATARNRGWRAAGAAVVCFTDDDCTPAPRWLAGLIRGFEQADIVQGQTLSNPDQESNVGPFSRTLRIKTEMGYYETCNMAYRREVLEKWGGFDERFRFPFGEDTDLAWRCRDGGATTTFAPDAVVYHDVWPSDFRASLKDTRRKEGIVLAFRNHPSLRRYVSMGVFYRPTHLFSSVVTGAGIAVLARPRSRFRWFMLAATGGLYTWNCRWTIATPRHRKWGWAGVVAGAYVLDQFEVAVMARASARYGTLLL
jgi:GT2 family glycosyltransferase